MKQRLLTAMLAVLFAFPARANIYVVFYATYDGRTGHTGIAIDNYHFIIRDVVENGAVRYVEDTVSDGTVTYFDMWPKVNVGEGVFDVQKDYGSEYHRFPAGRWDRKIYLSDIIYKGIPHLLNRAIDGLIKIPSTAADDMKLIACADSLVKAQKPYNAVHYNCTDFVMELLQCYYQRPIKAKEKILYARFNTPNKLFRRLSTYDQTTVLINPGEKSKGTFFRERFLNKIFHKKQDFITKVE